LVPISCSLARNAPLRSFVGLLWVLCGPLRYLVIPEIPHVLTYTPASLLLTYLIIYILHRCMRFCRLFVFLLIGLTVVEIILHV